MVLKHGVKAKCCEDANFNDDAWVYIGIYEYMTFSRHNASDIRYNLLFNQAFRTRWVSYVPPLSASFLDR